MSKLLPFEKWQWNKWNLKSRIDDRNVFFFSLIHICTTKWKHFEHEFIFSDCLGQCAWILVKIGKNIKIRRTGVVDAVYSTFASSSCAQFHYFGTHTWPFDFPFGMHLKAAFHCRLCFFHVVVSSSPIACRILLWMRRLFWLRYSKHAFAPCSYTQHSAILDHAFQSKDNACLSVGIFGVENSFWIA